MPVLHILKEAAESVLETMFFAETAEGGPAPLGGSPVIAEVVFHAHYEDGECLGRLSLAMPENCAKSIAADFEGIGGLGDVPPVAADQVALELANIICGATLTRMDAKGLFTLDSPVIASEFSKPAPGAKAAECWLEIPSADEGVLHLAIALENNS